MMEQKVIHVCPVCEYIHEDNSSEPWENLPEDFPCPACSVEKMFFEERIISS